VLSAVQTTPRVWAEHEVELLHTIANQAANAIYNAQLFQQVVAEQRQNKAIIESGLNGMYVTDRTGRISMFNHAAVTMTGWRQQEAIGAQWEDIFADVNASTTPSLIQRVITTQRPINSISGRVIRQRHGAPIPILEAATPLLDENGAVTGVVGTIWDLTRERQAELERADLLEFFTHELRTPISNLVSIAQMLDSPRVEKANRAELLALIKKEGRRLRKFADDFLHRNGAFAPAEPVKLTRLNIKTIVNKTVQRFRADDHTHYFRIKSPRPLPLVWATREHVEHILDNLLENAVNYSPDDTRITISIETDPEYVTVAVHDQGKGIPVGEHELIFHRYYRAKNSRGRIAGHGLGLAIVRKMVTEMGGKIWVESRPHHGATFRFTLRRQK
jgi:PAS domain S-box-containing protein